MVCIQIEAFVHCLLPTPGPQAPSSALPIGAERTVNPTRLLKVAVSPEILHSVLGVSHSKTQEEVLETNLAGFVYV